MLSYFYAMENDSLAFLKKDLLYRYGLDADTFISSQLERPCISIRLHPYKPFKYPDSDSLSRVPWCSSGLYLTQRPDFSLDPHWHSGLYYVQEASSMFLKFVVEFLQNRGTLMHILDLSAAPGGKTTILSESFPESLVVANEIDRSRAYRLLENVVKWGMGNVLVTNDSPRTFSPDMSLFDLVLIDAPCSGSGLFRKMPHHMNDWNMELVQECAIRQNKIGEDTIPYMKAGAYLVYSTCSFNAEENEEQLDYFCTLNNLKSISIPLSEDWGIMTSISDKGNYGYHFFPQRVNGEGFFIAILQVLPDNIEYENVEKNSKQLSCYEFESINFHQTEYKINNHHQSIIERLIRNHEVMYFGLAQKTETKYGDVPHQALANAIPEFCTNEMSKVTLSDVQAISYLRGESIPVNDLKEKRGYVKCEYDGYGLGWAKNVGNRLNNLYPKYWRIKKK